MIEVQARRRRLFQAHLSLILVVPVPSLVRRLVDELVGRDRVAPDHGPSRMFFFFQAEDGIRDLIVTGVQTCALPISGGVLAVNVNPGSANPIGGQTAAIKCWGRTVDEMVMREPAGLKSALGENPKRVYGERNETPSTRLGTAPVVRGAVVAAQNYQAQLAATTAR